MGKSESGSEEGGELAPKDVTDVWVQECKDTALWMRMSKKNSVAHFVVARGWLLHE